MVPLMSCKRAVIGIVLLVGSFPFFIFLFTLTPLGYLLVKLYWSHQINDFTLSIITNIPKDVLGISGLALYIAGRKDFLKCLDKDKGLSLAFVILGGFLTSLGVWFSLWNYGILEYYSGKIPGKPMTGERLLGYLLPFGWSVSWLISGVLWLADGLECARERDT